MKNLIIVLLSVLTILCSSCGGGVAQAKIPEEDTNLQVIEIYENKSMYIYELCRDGNKYIIVKAKGLGGGVSIIKVEK